uniref:AlNc14C6G886 protein n=1 Tax=Albugo laibachii Nc14 TaxID=890382 RepID=F0W1B7_9STRA|nr:AlNc14C6G886 [Albugo laibachii Nc14]|eukprot:CCA14844.1 AlNc14C6G886 [Albugo laibachii Nc14]
MSSKIDFLFTVTACVYLDAMGSEGLHYKRPITSLRGVGHVNSLKTRRFLLMYSTISESADASWLTRTEPPEKRTKFASGVAKMDKKALDSLHQLNLQFELIDRMNDFTALPAWLSQLLGSMLLSSTTLSSYIGPKFHCSMWIQMESKSLI